MNAGIFRKLETLTFLLITIMGVVNREVTVFYIVYLFWFQELVRTAINRFYACSYRKQDGSGLAPGNVFGSFLILFIYLIFIVVMFGFVLNSDNYLLVATNMRTLMLRNWYFNVNILIFVMQYLYYRKTEGAPNLQPAVFNRSHIILHISIIAGMMIQMLVVKKYPEYFAGEKLWGPALVILPFLLLKIFLGGYAETGTIHDTKRDGKYTVKKQGYD